MKSVKKQLHYPVKKPETKTESVQDISDAKAEIERMKGLLSKKIKDPNIARKAAMIISEMLKSKK